MNSIPKFCIVIPVNHNIGFFRLCLESLERLDYPRDQFKVVVVDVGQIPGLEAFARTELPKFSLPLLHLVLHPAPAADAHWLHEHRMNTARNTAVAACPAQVYVFTEDDASFEPDWLRKIESWLNEKTGALGGPDVLPNDMGPLAEALDELLNSPLGSPGRRKGIREEDFCPRKDYLVIPASVLAAAGPFPEDMLFGTEIEMCRRIRARGLDVKYMADNPIWHRRVTNVGNFLRRNVRIAAEKVQLLRRQGRFWKSAHALVLFAASAAVLLGALAFFSPPIAALWSLSAAAYIAIAIALAVRAFRNKRHLASAAAVLGLMPCHHASVACGGLKGWLSRQEATNNGPART